MDDACEVILTYRVHISSTAKYEIPPGIGWRGETSMMTITHINTNTVEKQKRRGNSKAQASHSNFSVMFAEGGVLCQNIMGILRNCTRTSNA